MITNKFTNKGTAVLRLFFRNAEQTACFSTKASSSFYHKDLQLTKATQEEMKQKPAAEGPINFGGVFTDHWAYADWELGKGWGRPVIEPLKGMTVHPGIKALHYAIQLFEGMKAFRGDDGKVRLFRPEINMARMNRTATRSSLPNFDNEELIKLISELVRLDSDWIPKVEYGAMYIRPTLIGTDPTLGVCASQAAKLFVLTCPVKRYFGSKENKFPPISLYADPTVTRAAIGGVGAFKMGCNYAPTIYVCEQAIAKQKCDQVLWLHGNDQLVTEAGQMNIFVFWTNEKGEKELMTPPLESGLILPGVTRQSLLELARQWGEFNVSERNFTIHDLKKASQEKRLHEMFGCGTAVTVTAVGNVVCSKSGKDTENFTIPTVDSKYQVMHRLHDALTDIHYGRNEDEYPGWTRVV